MCVVGRNKSKEASKIAPKEFSRFVELDIWRGLAVIGMIVFHAVYILNYFGVVRQRMFEGGWDIFGNFIRFSFLLLVGISMVISYKNGVARGNSIWQIRKRQIKRALIVFCAAALVTFFTYIFVHENFVRFGILHLIAVSIFVLSFIFDKKYLVLILSLVIYLVGQFFVWPRFSGALDSFPVFPWMALPASGVFLGHFLFDFLKKNSISDHLHSVVFKPFIFFGQHALKIYMLHVPILILLFWLLGVVVGLL